MFHARIDDGRPKNMPYSFLLKSSAVLDKRVGIITSEKGLSSPDVS